MKRKLTKEDLLRIIAVGEPAVSPSGDRIVFTVKRMEEGKNKYFSNLWLAEVKSGRLRQLTWGEQSDSHPLWRAEEEIFFFSNRGAKGKKQIWRIYADGGEAQPVTELKGEIASFALDAQGQRLVLSFRQAEEEEEERDGFVPDRETQFRYITRFHYKQDGQGVISEKHFRIWVWDLASGKAQALTDTAYDDQEPRWSPDGQQIAFIAKRFGEDEWDDGESDLWLMPATGGAARQLTTPQPHGHASCLAWSPDSQRIAFLGTQGELGTLGARNLHVWVASLADNSVSDGLPDFPHTCLNVTLGDTHARVPTPPIWSADGQNLLFLACDRGKVSLYRLSLRGGPPKAVLDAELEIATMAGDAKGRTLGLVVSQPSHPSELYTVSLSSKSPALRKLSSFNTPLMEEVDVATPEPIAVSNPTGQQVHGWILKPPGFAPTQGKYPLVLQVHGGPHMQFGLNFFFEMQLLAAAGYVVLFINPTGSQGYGEAFARAIEKAWGIHDEADCFAAVDHVVSLGYIDPQRIGVMGGSYGGYLTAWLIGRTKRFRAAIAERGVYNCLSFCATSDGGFELMYTNHDVFWKNPPGLVSISPLNNVEQIETPLMLIHSEKDLRCPIEQAEHLYCALKSLKREVVFLRVVGEGHDLSRSGRPRNRVKRLGYILQWLERHLGKGPSLT